MKKLLLLLLFIGCKPSYYEVKYTVSCVDCLTTFETASGTKQRYGDFVVTFNADKGQYLYLSSSNSKGDVKISISLDGTIWKSDKCSGNCSVMINGTIQ